VSFARYVLLGVAGAWALSVLATEQVTWRFFVVAMPATAGALAILGMVVFAEPFVGRLPSDHAVARALRQLRQLGTMVLLLGYLSALVVVLNVRLSRCAIEVRESEVVAIEDLWGPAGRVFPTARLVLRAWDGPGTVSVPLSPGQRRRHWVGQVLQLRVCRGRFGIPYVWRLVSDETATYERVVHADPGAREARRQLAYQHMEARRFGAASAAAWDYLEHHPDDTSHAEQFGHWLSIYQQFELGRPLLQWYLEQTESRRAYYLLAVTLGAAGDDEAATAVLEAGLTRHPDARDLRYMLAAHRRLGHGG
jgi:hypothetical protein